MKKPLTLRTIRNTPVVQTLLLLHKADLSSKQGAIILQIALLFLNNETKEIQEFGYSLLVKYCIKTEDYVPLYDIAASLGFVPIMHLLQNKSLLPERQGFLNEFMAAYRENFKSNNVYQTEHQLALFSGFSENISKNLAIIAPTSYGKSELIEQTVEKNANLNIGIIVPSKALISQTRRRVVKSLPSNTEQQVISHHDTAFNFDRPVVAVVTQERALRVLQKYPSLSFDILFIDEAHNLLAGDKRSRLLGSAIMINRLRNKKCAVKYLTPFLVDAENLRLVMDDSAIKQIKITEKLKTETYFICDIFQNNTLRIYDQFLNCFIDLSSDTYNDELKILKDRKKNKNVVYLNKPKTIEQFSELLSRQTNNIASPSLEKICLEIADYVHPQYRILDCLRRGTAYHHGSVPDVVRSYIESAFKNEPAITWIVTSSTLLEGVNIPAQALFILDPTKGRANLSASQFRNLVGRVNRFSEIFDPETGSPKLLLPEIYLIKCRFSRSNSNFEDYLSNVAKIDKKVEDDLHNPLLIGTVTDEKKNKERDDDFTYIENLEPSAVLREIPQRATTESGRLCFVHNVYELDILKFETIIDYEVAILRKTQHKIEDSEQLLAAIATLFISKLDENVSQNFNLIRLRNPSARRFYSMFFDWRINQVNYGRMIGSFIAYWKKILSEENDTTIFVGRWGNIARDGFFENYVDLKSVTDYELINLAIVRIKEEHDFLDNNLVKFVEIINDLDLLDENLYNKIKYGTNDPRQMALIRSGLSHIAASVLANKYSNYLTVSEMGEVNISIDIRNAFKRKTEKEIITFEIESSGLIK